MTERADAERRVAEIEYSKNCDCSYCTGYRHGLAAARAALEKWEASITQKTTYDVERVQTLRKAVAVIDALAAGATGKEDER